MKLPVGVGFTSPGPIGVDGLTITTGTPVVAMPRTTSSPRNLDRLYGPIMSASTDGVVSSAGRPSLRVPSVATLLV